MGGVFGNAPAPDPLIDSGSVGLRMFNLGTIPASVTPPRSWRRAAWFTVFASAAALVGLLVIASVLVGPSRTTNRFDALPNFPSGALLPTLGGPSTGTPSNGHTHRQAGAPTTRSTPAANRVAGGGNTPPAPGTPGSDSGGGANDGTDTGPGGTPTGAPAPSAPAPVVGTPPVVTTVSTGAPPAVDPTELVSRTKSFFGAVTSDVAAAADLTDNTIRDDATAIINRKYGDVSSIQVKSISLDPTSGLTISVLRVVKKDGSTTTQQTPLQFTLSGDPKIKNPGG